MAGALHPAGLRAQPASPAPLPAPSGPVVLSIAGAGVLNGNAPGRADFDMAMLAALPQHSFSTRAPWYAQRHKFSGPLLREVLRSAGAQGQMLRLTALNDYIVEMPFEDTLQFDVLLARLRDDQPMAVRDKGPLLVIYPFDLQPQLRNATHYARSAWQLQTITVL